jgi:hypothetical protein
MFDGSGEKSPHEPDEFDPESLGPGVPEVSTKPGDVDTEIKGAFWGLVFVANVAVMAIGLGLLFALLGGRPVFGGQLFLAGVILCVYVYYRVRKFQSD